MTTCWICVIVVLVMEVIMAEKSHRKNLDLELQSIQWRLDSHAVRGPASDITEDEVQNLRERKFYLERIQK